MVGATLVSRMNELLESDIKNPQSDHGNDPVLQERNFPLFFESNGEQKNPIVVNQDCRDLSSVISLSEPNSSTFENRLDHGPRDIPRTNIVVSSSNGTNVTDETFISNPSGINRSNENVFNILENQQQPHQALVHEQQHNQTAISHHQIQPQPAPLAPPQVNSQRFRKLGLGLSLFCPDCRDPYPNIVENFSAGDLLCGDCGLVLGDRVIDTRSEWRTFYNSDDNRRPDPSRVGSATDDLLGAMHVDSTVISQWDASSGSARELGRVHGRATNQKAEKQLFHAFREIQAMCERIGLQKVTSDSAKQLYKKVEDGKLLRGRASEAIMAACIYIGCRENGVTRTFKEVCDLAKVSKREIGRIYKVLAPLLEAPAQQISLESYVIRFSSALGLSQEIKRAAPIVIKRVISMGTLAGKSPVSIAAACLYFVNNLAFDPVSARGIAAVAGCTEATLRNAYRLLYESRFEIGKDIKMPRDVSSLSP